MSKGPVETASRTFRAAVEIVSHLLLCMIAVGAIYVFEQYLHYLYGNVEPMLFDRWPLKWLFQGIDLCLIIAFGASCVIESWNILRGNK